MNKDDIAETSVHTAHYQARTDLLTHWLAWPMPQYTLVLQKPEKVPNFCTFFGSLNKYKIKMQIENEY